MLAAILKSINPHPAMNTVEKLLPGTNSSYIIVVAILFSEWIMASWLISGIFRRTVWIVTGISVVLMIIVSAVIHVISPKLSCGCFGGTLLDLPSLTWVRIGLLMLLTGIGIYAHCYQARSFPSKTKFE